MVVVVVVVVAVYVHYLLVPGQVMIETFSATSNTSLSLKWQRLQPANHNGIIIGYDILLTNSTSRCVLQRINVDGENQTMYNFTGELSNKKNSETPMK